MSYLLDTNVCIKLLNNTSSLAVQRLAQQEPKDISLCTVVHFELYYGAYCSSRREQNLAKLERLFNQFTTINLDIKAAKIAGQIRAELKNKGTPIGVYDLQIAAIAIANNLTLVTHNVSEFQRIQELNIEDWEAEP